MTDDEKDRTTSDLGLHGEPENDSAPAQSSATDWDRSKSKPSGNFGASKRDEPKVVNDEDPKP
jgi:hypothetical protein